MMLLFLGNCEDKTLPSEQKFLCLCVSPYVIPTHPEHHFITTSFSKIDKRGIKHCDSPRSCSLSEK
jgi:hypothetical protein